MVARAVSARDWLTPLAVLIPIGAIPPLALWAPSLDPITTAPVFALLVLAAGVGATAAAGRHTHDGAYSIGSSGLLALVVSFLLFAHVPGTQGVCEA